MTVKMLATQWYQKQKSVILSETVLMPAMRAIVVCYIGDRLTDLYMLKMSWIEFTTGNNLRLRIQIKY